MNLQKYLRLGVVQLVNTFRHCQHIRCFPVLNAYDDECRREQWEGGGGHQSSVLYASWLCAECTCNVCVRVFAIRPLLKFRSYLVQIRWCFLRRVGVQLETFCVVCSTGTFIVGNTYEASCFGLEVVEWIWYVFPLL